MFTGLCFKQPQTERRAALQAQCHAQLPNTVLTRTELWRTRVILYSDTNKSCPCYSRLSPFFSKHNSVTWKSGLHYQMQSQILSIQRFKKKKKYSHPPLRKEASQNISEKQIPSWQQSRSHNPKSANTFPQLIVPPQEASPQPGVQVQKSSTFLHLFYFTQNWHSYFNLALSFLTHLKHKQCFPRLI